MTSLFAAIFCAAFSALNFALYATNGSPWSLGAGIFCGVLVPINLVVAARYL